MDQLHQLPSHHHTHRGENQTSKAFVSYCINNDTATNLSINKKNRKTIIVLLTGCYDSPLSGYDWPWAVSHIITHITGNILPFQVSAEFTNSRSCHDSTNWQLFLCRSLSCQRITLHKNLFISCMLNSTINVVLLTTVANKDSVSEYSLKRFSFQGSLTHYTVSPFYWQGLNVSGVVFCVGEL